MRLKYIGLKEDGETAFSHLSGIDRWMQGDENEVKDDVAKRMLLHPDVFALAGESSEPAVNTVDPSTITLAPGATVSEGTTNQAFITVDGQAVDLSGLDKAQLHDLAKRLDVEVHHASGAAKVIEALQAAFPAVNQPAE
jgi:hypothetical protein